MSFTTSWPLATEPLPPTAHRANGAHPIPVPLPPRPSIRPRRSLLLPLVSAAVLLALIGGLIFGIVENRNDGNPTVPAVIQGSPSPEASPLGSDWGQYRGGVERTSYTNDPGPGGNLNLLWSFTADESLNDIMESDGTVVAYGADGGLYAIDALTGEQRWAIDLSTGEFADTGWVPQPAIVDGVVYVTSLEGSLVAVDADTGAIIWQHAFPDGLPNGPTIADGRIYLAAGEKRMVALDGNSGDEIWSTDIPGGLGQKYPTLAEGKLFTVDETGIVHGLDLQTGETVWASQPIQAQRVGSYRDGRLFVPGADGSVTAFDTSSGTVLWSLPPGQTEAFNLVLTEDAVIVTTAGDRIRAVDPVSGDELWSIPAPTITYSPHAGGQTLYVELDEGVLSALDLATGKQIGRTAEIPGAGSTAAIFGDALIVSGRDGTLYAFGPSPATPSALVATSPVAIDRSTPVPTGVVSADTITAAPALEDSTPNLLYTLTFPISPYIGQAQKSPDGTFWLTMEDGRVLIYDRDGNLLETRQYQIGSGSGQFSWEVDGPSPLYSSTFTASYAWLPDGRIFVTDGGNARIQVLDAQGSVIGSWGERGDRDGQFQAPAWIALTPDDEVAVVDFIRGDIQWFDLDGHFLRKITGLADGRHFGRPFMMEYDQDGNFWVVDIYYSWVSKFDAAGNELFTIGGVQTAAPGALHDPVFIDFDENGNIWIADMTNSRLQLFDKNGNLLSIFDGCETMVGCFIRPGGVFAGGNGFLYVFDATDKEIELYKFQFAFLPTEPIMAAGTPPASTTSPEAE